jgi:hypothetical protein
MVLEFKILKGSETRRSPRRTIKFAGGRHGKTAKALGLGVPRAIMVRADKVIE